MTSAEVVPEAVDEAELELHGVLYSVSVLVHGDELLIVRIEDRDSLDTWHGEFAAKYVEDITSKTGSFKKFAVFVRMLQSAVTQQSDSVFVDLLTCQDLELLKAKKAAAAAGATNGGVPHQQQQQLPASLASKRYLILTYASEFDRVHYPLPLLPDEQPDPSRFKAVIASLRQQLAAVTAGLSQHGRQQQQQLVLPQQRGRGRGANEQVDAEVSLLASRLEVAMAELEGERANHRREMRKKAREVQELQEELGRSRDVARELRLRIKTLEADLEAARSSSGGGGAVGVAATAGRGGYRRPAAADRYTYGHSSYLAGSSKFPSRPTNQYPAGGSRNTSRGSSPASSRGQSPSYTRPWAQHSSPPRPPRPSSAPPKQRFDPTEYVRQKREREAAAAAGSRRSSRGGSPAPSVRSRAGDASGASTPRSSVSRASSFDRRSAPERGVGAVQALGSRVQQQRSGAISELPGNGSSGGYDRQALYGRSGSNGRGSSSGGGWQRQAGGSSGSNGGGRGGYDPGRPSSAGRQLMQRPGSSGSSRDQLGAVYGVAAAAAGGARASSRSNSRPRLSNDIAPGRDGPGSASPGRALQGVRDKLDAYYAKQQQQRTHAGAVKTLTAASPATKPAAAPSPRQQPLAAVAQSPVKAAAPGSSGAVFKDASSEIADIDQRLHALQSFLKMAKSSVGAA